MSQFDPTFTADRGMERDRVIALTVKNYDHIMSKVTVATEAEQMAVNKNGDMFPRDSKALAKSADFISGMDVLAAETKKLTETEIVAMMDALKAELAGRARVIDKSMPVSFERLSKAMSVDYSGAKISIPGVYEGKVEKIETLDQTLSAVKFQPMIQPATILSLVELNCPHDPGDTGFGFAYCKMCNAKMRLRGGTWQVEQK